MKYEKDNTVLDIKKIIEMFDGEMSVREIAEHLGTYPNKIKRALEGAGRKMRSNSESQKIALKNERRPHPTKGKPRSEETKEKISRNITKFWNNLKVDDPDKYNEYVERFKQQWQNLDEKEKERMRKLAAKAIRKASVEGSKLENTIREALIREGFAVEFHRKNIVLNQNLEVDIYIPTYKIAIEVNGPAHYFPIWGDESLQRHVDADKVKMGLLLTHGFRTIIVKHLNHTESKAALKDFTDKLINTINSIITENPKEFIKEIEL